MNKKQLLTLKAKIKGLAAEGSRTRKFINSSTGEKRWSHWQTKRWIGEDARLYLIAYGLLRGVPYDKIEPNVSREKYSKLINDWDLRKLLSIINLYTNPYKPFEQKQLLELLKKELKAAA